MPDVDGGKTVRIVLRGCEVAENGGLSDRDMAEWDVARLCEFLGMTRVGDPFTCVIAPGISCGLVIKESHLFIHTWPEDSSVRVVIDSCVDFDHTAAAEWLQCVFGAERYECHVI